MSLNIQKSGGAQVRGPRRRVTGESLTEAVTTALRERLARIAEPDDLATELLQLGEDCAARLKEPWRSLDHGALLYDEQGLPK